MGFLGHYDDAKKEQPMSSPKLTPADYLKKILTARVYDVAVETATELAPLISDKYNNTVYLKREDLQPVFSFKIRGAYNKAFTQDAVLRTDRATCADF